MRIACSISCLLVASSALAQTPAAQSPQCTTERLVGTWERISLLRNGLSVQPPDAPLFVKLGSDGYWSMMEMPDRAKVDKPLERQTEKELWSRFERVEGGYGTWTLRGDVLTRRHLANIAPGGEGNNQDRTCTFEADVLALVGTAANRSPQARFKKLPAQPMKPHNLAGTWERTSLTIDGKPQQPPRVPLVMLLGEDGWFSQTQLPTGRKSAGKPLEKYTVDDYVKAFGGVSAARGTYTVEGSTFTRKHVADVDPNAVGYEDSRQFTLDAGVLTLRGKTRAGERIEATFRRLKPSQTSTP